MVDSYSSGHVVLELLFAIQIIDEYCPRTSIATAVIDRIRSYTIVYDVVFCCLHKEATDRNENPSNIVSLYPLHPYSNRHKI